MSKSILAVTGKGGTGKTAVVAIMAKILTQKYGHRLLVIDADSAISLPYALGVELGQTVADVRQRMIEDPRSRSGMEDRHVRLIVADTLQRGEGFDLLVMGRPEGPGCYCSINDLLRYGIETLSRQYDVTLIDCEAGPEQVNRRVVSSVDVLVIVSDASIRGVRVANSIREVVQRDGQMKSTRTGLVINRLKTDDRQITEFARQCGLDIFGRIPEDENITDCDAAGRPILEVPESSPSVRAVREILRTIGLPVAG